MYSWGGFNGSTTLYIYDPTSKATTKTKLNTSIPIQSDGITFNGTLYIIGGKHPHYTKTTFLFEQKKGMLIQKAELLVAKLL